jgi:hypothetical protein
MHFEERSVSFAKFLLRLLGARREPSENSSRRSSSQNLPTPMLDK